MRKKKIEGQIFSKPLCNVPLKILQISVKNNQDRLPFVLEPRIACFFDPLCFWLAYKLFLCCSFFRRFLVVLVRKVLWMETITICQRWNQKTAPQQTLINCISLLGMPLWGQIYGKINSTNIYFFRYVKSQVRKHLLINIKTKYCLFDSYFQAEPFGWFYSFSF